jgi:hypothetical protein
VSNQKDKTKAKTMMWQKMPPMPGPRAFSAAVVVREHQIYDNVLG